MPDSLLRACLPPVKGVCSSVLTSGLALGLAMTTIGMVPAQAAQTPSTSPTALTDTLDPTFVQEGTPSPHGGQVVMWGERDWAYNGATRMVPEALPEGVYATAISSDSSDLLVLRSDGLVDGWDSAGMLNPVAPPTGTSYTAISASSGRLLRSDGVIVDTDGDVAITPPAGVFYTALSGFDALRSDGAIAPLDDGASCADARRPSPGLQYTAISSVPDYAVWAAVRSDGALVYCTASGSAVVRQPSAGTRFVGVDRSGDEVLAATSDGQIVAALGMQPPAVPQGRSVISLAAISKGIGAAVLDDGSILRWGMTGEGAQLPAVPTDRATYSAVENGAYNSHRWAIMVGDPIPVDVVANIAKPADRPLRVTDDLRVDATIRSADGTPAFGHIVVEAAGPDELENRWPRRETLTGVIELALDPRLSSGEGVGRWDVSVTFVGSPFATTTVTTPTEMAEPSPVKIVTSGPATWRQSAHDGTLCFDVESEDGSPIWRNSFSLTVLEDPTKGISGGFSPPECVNSLDLRAGTWTVRFEYGGWGDADSAEWTGPVVVRQPAVSRMQVNLPVTWHYGQMPGTIPFAVDAEELSARGVVRLLINGQYATGAQLEDGIGTIDTWSEAVPGTYLYRFEYEGGFGALPSSWEQMVTVRPGLFTKVAPPTVTGMAKVGATLTAARGTWDPEPTGVQYSWKADGTPIEGATSSVLKVPASAAGKEITVTLTGERRYYSTGSATSAPTATVAPTTFTAAPKPAIKGTAQVGRTLTVTRGTWSPSPSSVKYVWKANGTTISTQTSSSFVVPASAKGKRLTVTVTGSRTGYTTRSVTSSATRTVAAGTFSARRPAIKGTTRVGSTLTVVRGTWTPSPSALKYVWKANGVTISTRTSSTFVVPARARGKQLTVTVTGAKAGYTSKSVASYRTATIR